ncbi:Yip1 family protein [Cereibacter changlensis]|uniref:Yip1 family protein n=1 Tax=Cereibacter changlensis TaxID=402884 RepID=UPI0040332485
MELTFGSILQLARFTVQKPREGARAVLSLNLPNDARWSLLLLVAIGAALLTSVSIALLPAEMREMLGGGAQSPLVSAGLQSAALLLLVGVMTQIGRWRGGKGSFADALLLVGWLQFILLLVQAVQLASQLVAPFISEIIGIAGIALFFWLLTNFVAELHGFRSLGKVFAGILLTMFALSFVLALFLMPLMAAQGV